MMGEDDQVQVSELDEATLQKIQNAVWVQCENPQCLKWRQLTKSEGVILDDDAPWYCSMNPDQHHNSCDDVEEDYRHFESLVRKSKLCYITSILPCGSLVWAKVAGFCRWPGVVSPDPIGGRHVCTDHNGNPMSYHVEFLGEKHSHSWVASRGVELFGPPPLQADKDATLENNSTLPSASGVTGNCAINSTRRRKKSKLVTCHKVRPQKESKNGSKTKYRGGTVEAAVTEANQLLDQLPHTRLLGCVFKFDEHLDSSRTGESRAEEKDVADENAPAPERKGRPPKACKENPTEGGVHSKSCNGQRKKRETNRKQANPRKHVATPSASPDDVEEESKPHIAAAAEDGDTRSEISSGEQESLAKHLTQSVSLVGRTKEEKFTLDVQSYQKNQKAFDEKVQAFMSEHGVSIRRLPVWRNMPISLYQLFLAVWDRGGFYQVSERKQWSAVYREVASESASHGGEQAKRYYSRNLLPYELYATGKDFTQVVHKLAMNKKPLGRKPSRSENEATSSKRVCRVHLPKTSQGSASETMKLPVVVSQGPASHTVKSPALTTSQRSLPQLPPLTSGTLREIATAALAEERECVLQYEMATVNDSHCGSDQDQKLKSMLQEMEGYSQQCAVIANAFAPGSEGAAKSFCQLSDRDSCSEASSQKRANAACAYGQAVFPDECSQKVMDSPASSSHKILHEMQALQQQLNSLEQGMHCISPDSHLGAPLSLVAWGHRYEGPWEPPVHRVEPTSPVVHPENDDTASSIEQTFVLHSMGQSQESGAYQWCAEPGSETGVGQS